MRRQLRKGKSSDVTTLVRYEQDGIRYGEVRGTEIHPLHGSFPEFTPSDENPVDMALVRLLAPVMPSKIVAVGPNYHAHFVAGGSPPPRPYLWIKPSSTVLDPEGEITLPDDAPMVCHESELAIIIGHTATNLSPEQADEAIFGYSCINDVTSGQLTDMAAYLASQEFVDGKTYDGFGPIGPTIVTDFDPSNVRIRCRVNGETRQDHRSSDQIWKPAELVSLISKRMTLYAGDVIATGSPPGPGPLAPGDVVEVEIEGIGILRNRIKAVSGRNR
jgi:2-keto-4-pentenoate hydratase/2-oxohepta-3-ene-1,7-dioic acid hydratase in catechol pathway